MKNYSNITRQDFMNFFRDDEQLNKLSADDKIEIFRTILIGSTDITKEL
jgi:putative ubiquitin-RnfH superfamily antitoxin RatB of RatAB toxin-antitoxin module